MPEVGCAPRDGLRWTSIAQDGVSMVNKLTPSFANQQSRPARANARTRWPPKRVRPAEALPAARESPPLLHRPAVYVGSYLSFFAPQCRAIRSGARAALCDRGVFEAIHSTGFKTVLSSSTSFLEACAVEFLFLFQPGLHGTLLNNSSRIRLARNSDAAAPSTHFKDPRANFFAAGVRQGGCASVHHTRSRLRAARNSRISPHRELEPTRRSEGCVRRPVVTFASSAAVYTVDPAICVNALGRRACSPGSAGVCACATLSALPASLGRDVRERGGKSITSFLLAS
ncbi:hypothetical protein C8R45DRAFT_1111087 [Mycena sanguinolenta]|nr:hypothetical protein C8R45DRAFT_1111087 [Mycena sanguinolenta]